MPMQGAVVWELPFGARPLEGGGVTFRLWAPRAKTLAVCPKSSDSRPIPMRPGPDHVFEVVVPQMRAGDDYMFLIDGDRERTDPYSRHQPHGVHGPSRVVDPEAFAWTDAEWRGIELDRYVVYEMHVGTFTPEGTFDAAVAKLGYLRRLGITAVEIMPVAAFPGDRGWGYDGVYPYAPHHCYGGPDGLKRLIDACHRAGLAVIMDVVYNHLGPDGNYLAEFFPVFSRRYRTPWGEAINFDDEECDGVRRYFVDNALYWLAEYHVDALRLDAVHGIFDFGARHILREIADEFHGVANQLGRQAYLIAESDLNDVRVIDPPERGGHGIDAQWSDDFHHAMHSLLTGADRGYFEDFGTMADLHQALTEGFVYNWKRSRHRKRRHGSSSAHVPASQLVVCIQNHDQIPNGSQGDRIDKLVEPQAHKLAATVLLCAPFIPMLFMGQEYGETAPFHYFTDHTDPNLARAVSEGRKKELASFGEPCTYADPQDLATFDQCKLRWDCLGQPSHEAMLRLYQDLLSLRRASPALSNCRKDLTRAHYSEQSRWLAMQRTDPSGAAALVLCNFTDRPQRVPVRFDGPWNRALYTQDAVYGGSASPPPDQLSASSASASVLLQGWDAVVYTRS